VCCSGPTADLINGPTADLIDGLTADLIDGPTADLIVRGGPIILRGDATSGVWCGNEPTLEKAVGAASDGRAVDVARDVGEAPDPVLGKDGRLRLWGASLGAPKLWSATVF
jgi:hypothetical protein